MKKLSISIISSLFLAACATTSVKEETVSSMGLSHTAIMGISAFYYCANGSWPESITAIQEYEEQRQAMAHVQIQWEKLKQHSQYMSYPTYKVESTIELSETEAVVVTSGQMPPKCSGNNVELQGAYVNM